MIEIEKLSFGYKAKLFSGLELALAPGNIYGLLGRNGAGKTTLLKLISGLRFAQSGTCRVLGFDPARRPAQMLEDLYFVPEDLFVPPIQPSLFEKLYAPLYPRFDSAALAENMREFELEPGKKLSEMSYGQKKKFLVAFGLASRCRIVLLDEPTNGLDIPSKSQFRRLLARSGGEDQIILISTHQVRDMENLIDPIIILDQGKVIFHQHLQEAARRLAVTIERAEPSDDGVLYAEKSLGGWVVARQNSSGEEANLDLEVLFNAVVSGGQRMQTLFAGARVEA